ncbi:hypothetical protein [Micromonospora craniellae]|uniref:Uncharacterized protein n=1 Tax=Micromonospora craniellae TaxID=2294034 RepID=A0A372FV28_9ACTN|nr:hypothetical protein [Micromonospora craniellae]QOC92380.1 hypothetical protein ID554_00845 [Micromonospora craniellae]RFS44621.1 hypothetical protein D0Q02_21520 [Micromonospora craniellae]
MDELTIEQRATRLLAGDDVDKDDVRFFLSRLLQVQEEQGRGASRAVTRGLLLAAAFVLLTHSTLLEAELLGMKIHDISPVRLVIPVAMMLMVLRAVTALRLSIFYRRVFREVAGQHQPSWRASGLIPLLSPWNGPMSTHASPVRLDVDEHPAVDRLHQVLRTTDSWAGITALTVFQVYAFVMLFHDPRVPTIATVASLGVTVSLMAFVAAYLWYVRRSRLTPAPHRRM